MDYQFIDRVKHALNSDIARRLMIKYFMDKGFNNFDKLLYPPMVQDISHMIPELSDKIEVIPHAININPFDDKAQLGWNLFALGIQRQYLGETYHTGLKSLAMQLQTGMVLSEDMVATRQATPRRIINFVTRILDTHTNGYIDLTPRTRPAFSSTGFGSQAMNVSQFFNRSGY